jgi:hypothetical protein
MNMEGSQIIALWLSADNADGRTVLPDILIPANQKKVHRNYISLIYAAFLITGANAPEGLDN